MGAERGGGAGRGKRGPAPRALGAIGEPVYRWFINRINRRFDRGEGVRRLGLPVISVGNLSVGGTGKTPTAAWLVRGLGERGVRAGIAMRGYGGGPGGALSDEADEYRRLLPGVALAVGADRYATVFQALGTEAWRGVGCVVLDDGFQHRALHRDLDIVLLDATANPFEDRLLPAGWLRDPVESLARAHATIITHAEAVEGAVVEGMRARVKEIGGEGLTVAVSRHEWAGLVMGGGGDGADEALPLEWLKGKRVVAACAIGNPEAFVREAGRRAEVAGRLVLRDHDPFGPGAVETLAALARGHRAEAIIVTEKDWAKLRRVPGGTWACPVVRARLRMRFEAGEAELLERAVRVCGVGSGGGGGRGAGG